MPTAKTIVKSDSKQQRIARIISRGVNDLLDKCFDSAGTASRHNFANELQDLIISTVAEVRHLELDILPYDQETFERNVRLNERGYIRAMLRKFINEADFNSVRKITAQQILDKFEECGRKRIKK